MIETKFKDTEFGKIPKDWAYCTFEDVLMTFSSGATPYRGIPEYYKGNIRWISSGELNYNTINDTLEHITNDAVVRTNLKIHQPGTFLMAITGLEAAGTRGRCAIVGKPSTTNQSCLAINGTEKMGTDYLYWFYNFWAETLAFKYAQGTKQQSFTADIVRKLPIYCPVEKSEQERIAKALSSIDALISQLDKLIEKKRAIKQGAMQQLLTGKIRLKDFSTNIPYKKTEIGFLPYEWDVKTISEISSNFTGLTYHPSDVNEYGKLVLRSSNIQNSKLVFEDNVYVDMDVPKRAIVKVGDILVCVRNGSSDLIGKCAMITPEADGVAFGAFMTVLRTNVMSNKYLFYVWSNKKTQNQIHETFGATINQITSKDFDRILIPVPSIKEQNAIANVLSLMDEEISALEVKRDKYIGIKTGMMQQLLTGKIRLMETVVKTYTPPANVHFRRSVLAAEIADRLCDEPTFGHVKMEKILFLSERMCKIDIGSHYHRDAAGPYDNRALRSIDSQLKKQKWFEVKKIEKGNRYVPMQNRGKHSTYFNRYYADVQETFDKIISTFKTWNTERCEIVATLYSAWEDLLQGGKSFTDADIVNEVLNNWHESKKRIPQERWLNAIEWMRNKGFVPNADNNVVQV